MRSHRDLPLEAPVANRTVKRQRFRVRRKVFGQMVLTKETFLANFTFVRFHPGVPHFVPPHVGAVREFHIAYVAHEQLAIRLQIAVVVALRPLTRRQVRRQARLVRRFVVVASVAPVHGRATIRDRVVVRMQTAVQVRLVVFHVPIFFEIVVRIVVVVPG